MAVVGFGALVDSLGCGFPALSTRCLVALALWFLLLASMPVLSLFVNDANALTSVGISVRIIQCHTRCDEHLRRKEPIPLQLPGSGPQEPILPPRGQEEVNNLKCIKEKQQLQRQFYHKSLKAIKQQELLSHLFNTLELHSRNVPLKSVKCDFCGAGMYLSNCWDCLLHE